MIAKSGRHSRSAESAFGSTRSRAAEIRFAAPGFTTGDPQPADRNKQADTIRHTNGNWSHRFATDRANVGETCFIKRIRLQMDRTGQAPVASKLQGNTPVGAQNRLVFLVIAGIRGVRPAQDLQTVLAVAEAKPAESK